MSCSGVKALEITISAFIGCTGSKVGHWGKSVQSATRQLSSDNRRSWRCTSTKSGAWTLLQITCFKGASCECTQWLTARPEKVWIYTLTKVYKAKMSFGFWTTSWRPEANQWQSKPIMAASPSARWWCQCQLNNGLMKEVLNWTSADQASPRTMQCWKASLEGCAKNVWSNIGL